MNAIPIHTTALQMEPVAIYPEVLRALVMPDTREMELLVLVGFR